MAKRVVSKLRKQIDEPGWEHKGDQLPETHGRFETEDLSKFDHHIDRTPDIGHLVLIQPTGHGKDTVDDLGEVLKWTQPGQEQETEAEDNRQAELDKQPAAGSFCKTSAEEKGKDSRRIIEGHLLEAQRGTEKERAGDKMGREEAVDRPEGESEHQMVEPRKRACQSDGSKPRTTTYWKWPWSIKISAGWSRISTVAVYFLKYAFP